MHREVDKIRAKMLSQPWPKFVNSVRLSGFRGWTGEIVSFEFPVVAIAGENGSGKSTVLESLACLYAGIDSTSDAFFPSTFFRDTPWDSVRNATIEFNLTEGSKNRSFVFRKKRERWRYPSARPRRHVFFFDISRTLPVDATIGYGKIASKKCKEVSARELDKTIGAYYSSIMGRRYDKIRFALSNISPTVEVGIVSWGGAEYSQFHQGAGEDAILDMMAPLQNVPSFSLVLVDEIEASLHPRSQRRLIHFLLWLTRVKQLQVVVSTHSPYVLEELPPESRIYLERKTDGREILPGVTPDFALNRMDDIANPELFVFAEDPESITVVRNMLQYKGLDISRIMFIPIGPANIVSAIAVASKNERFPVTAVGVLDADQAPDGICLRLPGSQAPERQVVEDVRRVSIGILATRLELSEPSVGMALDNAMALRDHHEWLDYLSRQLRQTREYLWETLCHVWVRHCVVDDVLRDFGRSIADCLDSHH